MGGGTEIIVICIAVYLVGAYAMTFACGYFESLSEWNAILWPFLLAAWIIVGALLPFIFLGMWLYNAGLALSGRRP